MSAGTLAGVLLIVVPLAFNAAFAFLAARFDYPDILRRPTDEVLERFQQGGTALVLVWWAFALTAVLFAHWWSCWCGRSATPMARCWTSG